MGALAVLAVVALSYSATVRVERTGALRAAEPPDGAAAAKVVADEIAAILAADIFGNKIVTPDVPRYFDPSGNPHTQAPNAANPRVWPSAFEDGDFSDYPFTIADPNAADFTYNIYGPFDGVPHQDARLGPDTLNPGFYGRALPDDAWLASAEPFFDPISDNHYWPQITNLRSAYRWRPVNPSAVNQTFWARDDGRFADLGQWFRQRIQRPDGRFYANPDAEITYGADNDAWQDPLSSLRSGPQLGVHNYNSPNNSPTRVFDYHMNGMHLLHIGNVATARTITGEPTHADTRFWADADGDYRPDSRWQEIEALRGLNGWRWVVATRIIDNSALINVNTALEFGHNAGDALWNGTNHIGFGVGETPADVDLLRLLREAYLNAENPSQNGVWNSVVNTTDYGYGAALEAYDRHVDRGRGMLDFLETFNGYAAVDGTNGFGWSSSPTSNEWRTYIGNNTFLLRAHRAAAWTYFAAALDPISSFARRYGLENEIELRTYWASNDDRVVSDLETRLDFRYLPGDNLTQPNADPEDRIAGPMRASRATNVERSYEFIQYPGGSNEKRPSVFDVRDDTRRLLTTVSGVSDLSPIPVLNPALDTSFTPARPVFDRFVNRKVRLADFAAPRSDAHRAELIRDAFEAFVWALAPLATDQPLWRLGQGHTAPPRQGSEFHYGGGPNSPAAWYADSMNTSLGDPLAAYAVLRAASLAVNLATASDPDAAPIVARLFNVQEREPNAPSLPGVVHLGARFSHGDIPAASLPDSYVGAAANGVTLVGLDRQPFLREVYTLAAYQHHAATGGLLDWNDNTITNDSSDQLGSIIAVEIGNPWPENITLEGYSVRFIDASNIELSIKIPDGEVINAGESVIYYVEHYNTTHGGSWNGIGNDLGVREVWEAQVNDRLTGGGEGDDDSNHPKLRKLEAVDVLTPWTADSYVMFQDFDTGDSSDPYAASVLLVHEFTIDTMTYQALVDRMSPPSTSDRSFPVKLDEDFPFTVGQCFLGNDGNGDPIFGDDLRGTGRLYFLSTLRRPSSTPDDPVVALQPYAGFPAYVIERRESNVLSAHDPREIYGTDASGAYEVAVSTSDASFWQFIRTVPGGLCAAGALHTQPRLPETSFPAEDKIDDEGEGQIINTLGIDKRGRVDPAIGELPTFIPFFQLFVPNGPLLSTSELFMLSAFAHTYVHTPTDAGAPNLDNAANPDARDPGTWRTVSEQLGENAQLFSNSPNEINSPPTPDMPIYPNPWLVGLDPSRYVLHATITGDGLLGPEASIPDHMAVPLAVRVLDVFEGMPTAAAGGLTPGRINVNTAPVRALRMLPFISPENELESTNYEGEIAETIDDEYNQRRDRAYLIADYRDTPTFPRHPDFFAIDARSTKTNINGLRVRGVASLNEPVRGFGSIGELPLLAKWSNTSANQNMVSVTPGNFDSGVQYAHFAEAAIADESGNRANTGVSESLVGDVFSVDGLIDLRLNAKTEINYGGAGQPTIVSLDPVDDAEERMAVFRAVSNIVSTRSDVFTAWFVVRAYDPADIAAIRVDVANPNGVQIGEYMEQLPIAHESRWLAVFDRSNVVSPIDRPRLLLLTQLPK